MASFIEVHPIEFPVGCYETLLINTDKIETISVPADGCRRTLIFTSLPFPMSRVLVWESIIEVRALIAGEAKRFDEYRKINIDEKPFDEV